VVILSLLTILFNKAEYEFFQFKAPPSDPHAPVSERNTSSTATFLQNNPVNSLPSLTEGMFGYSLTRPVHNKEYYYGIFDACEKFNVGIEGWHTESGPGVFEAALSFGEVVQMADKAGLFKSVFENCNILPKLTHTQICCQVSRNTVRNHTMLHGQAQTRSPRK
jgi:glutamine synthetase